MGQGHFNSKFLHDDEPMKNDLPRQFNCTNPLVVLRCRLFAGWAKRCMAQTIGLCTCYRAWRRQWNTTLCKYVELATLTDALSYEIQNVPKILNKKSAEAIHSKNYDT